MFLFLFESSFASLSLMLIECCQNIKNTQQSPLKMLEKTAKPCTLYDTVREHGPPDVKMETNEISPSHESENQVKIKLLL